ncbi:terminase large subunit [Arthrobacter phage KellEzio]|uniref:Terminase large subunit, nuclease domain n=1 Tax=Arthrobacter phage KellEzio TaxID=1796995 RepID=A0A140G695_9CAUD|nr:terminase large subunit [Arthrobacter phage KellEzio]AMM44180.1 terminase large subunit, nuclease domain [Arthrobacter phage KellEzio]
MTETTLGFKTRPQTAPKQTNHSKPQGMVKPVNTRHALWPERWPAIALQSCIDTVEAAPPDQQAEVKFNLPCQDCEKSAACLNAKRKELGPLLYDREINTKPRSSESSLFPMELVAPMLWHDESLVPHWHPPFTLEHHFKVVQAWDLAWSEKIGGDWLVCMTAYIDLRTGQKRLLDLQRWQKISFDDQVKMIEAKWAIYNADLVIIESDAAQAIWSQHMKKNSAVPVKEHSAGGKQDLASGVPGLLIQFENKKWELPYKAGTMRHDEMETFLAELEAFGWVDGKLQGVGEHDDTVMCFYHLNYGLDIFAKAMAGGSNQHRAGVVPGARA